MQHISQEHFIAAMGGAATGVSVVTTDGPEGRCGITVSAISSVSADPPLVLACVNRKSPAVKAIEGNRVFAINVLAARNRDFAETFAGRPVNGKPFDFANHPWDRGETGAPLVSDATAVFECEVDQAYDAGTHRIFIGRVIAARCGDGEPLVYCNRQFRRIADY
jgi:flavin reductase (DIM6/NTAB) family NADH-FMN oxidoreductase RutF